MAKNRKSTSPRGAFYRGRGCPRTYFRKEFSMGRITTPLLSLTRVVIKVNIKRYRFMQLQSARKR
jgi:hypothetical protein